jgi:hypothetical protein
VRHANRSAELPRPSESSAETPREEPSFWPINVRLGWATVRSRHDAVRRFHQPGVSGPVVQIKFPIIGKVWITTTQEMAGRVLKDSKTFTLRKNGGGPAGLRWWMNFAFTRQ